MQIFTRRGFQLRTASFETRVAYTGFLIFMLLGVGSLVALSVCRTGLSPQAIATYYRGGDAEMSFPKSFWQLMETSHFHLFSVPVVLLILAHLLYATPVSARIRLGLTLFTYAGALLEICSPWAVRYLAGGFSYALLAGWLLLAAGMLAMVGISLVSLWGPDRWNAWLTAPPENGDTKA